MIFKKKFHRENLVIFHLDQLWNYLINFFFKITKKLHLFRFWVTNWGVVFFSSILKNYTSIRHSKSSLKSHFSHVRFKKIHLNSPLKITFKITFLPSLSHKINAYLSYKITQNITFFTISFPKILNFHDSMYLMYLFVILRLEGEGGVYFVRRKWLGWHFYHICMSVPIFVL